LEIYTDDLTKYCVKRGRETEASPSKRTALCPATCIPLPQPAPFNPVLNARVLSIHLTALLCWLSLILRTTSYLLGRDPGSRLPFVNHDSNFFTQISGKVKEDT